MRSDLHSRRVEIAFQPRSVSSHRRLGRVWFFILGVMVGFFLGMIYAQRAVGGP